MKHVVFIVGSYYPLYSAVGKCIGNIAGEFEKEYKVTVICEKNVVGQLSEETLGRQHIIRITTKMHYNRIMIEKALKEEKGIKKLLFKMLLIFFKLMRYLKVAISKVACDGELTRAYIKALNELEETVDIIIPTCVPFETVIAALNFKEKNPRVDVVPYLFDLFAENKNINRGSLLQKVHWRSNIKIERKMFEASKAIFHVGNWTKHIERYFPTYKTKTHEVEHPLLFCKRDDWLRLENNDYIHVVFVGSIDTSICRLESILEVIEKLQMGNVQFDFYSYGSVEKCVEEHSAMYDFIVAHGNADSKKAQQAMAQANVFLSMGDMGNSQVLSKTVEYMATGKPIVHFAQNKENPSLDILRRYPMAKIVDMSSEIDLDELKRFIRNYEKTVIEFDEVMNVLGSMSLEYIGDIILNNRKSVGYKLIFAGALKKGYVDAQYVVDLFSDDLLKYFKLFFYVAGNGVDVVKKVMKDNIIVSGWIEKKRLDEEYRDADAFISIAEKSGTNISSKIFEYMSTGKPIIHIYYSDNDENIKYLTKYKKSLCIKAERTELLYNKVKLVLFLLRTAGIGREGLFDDELFKCTPNYIFNMIQKECC